MKKTKSKAFHGNTVPYIVYEGTVARMERHIKRLWILLIAVVIALVGSILIPRRDIIYETSEESQTSSVNTINDKLIPPAAASVCAEMRENHDKKKRAG